MHPESLSQEIESGDESGSVLGGESSTSWARRLAGRLWLWWSMFVAGVLLLVFGPPAIIVSYLAGRRHWVYPWALFGARNWLRLSGVRVRVSGLERLDPGRSYVFVANHRSFLDTAALFYHLRRR
ncbi:MAG TPA: hypothetical protein VN228_06520, partial [Pyrinomonadaceae bacterium]|nr:hypothetical protein [Pyrinomonadaceae bacterium]